MSYSHTTQVIRNFIELIQNAIPELNRNVFLTTSMDYSEDGISIAIQEDLPIMVLEGPIFQRNDLFTSHQKPSLREFDGGGKEIFTTYTAEEATDILFTVRLLSNLTHQTLDLSNKLYGYMLNGKFVSAEKCPGSPQFGVNEYEIDLIGKPESGRMVNRSNLREMIGQIVIRGVLVSDGQIFEEGYVAEEVLTEFKKL